MFVYVFLFSRYFTTSSILPPPSRERKSDRKEGRVEESDSRPDACFCFFLVAAGAVGASDDAAKEEWEAGTLASTSAISGTRTERCVKAPCKPRRQRRRSLGLPDRRRTRNFSDPSARFHLCCGCLAPGGSDVLLPCCYGC